MDLGQHLSPIEKFSCCCIVSYVDVKQGVDKLVITQNGGLTTRKVSLPKVNICLSLENFVHLHFCSLFSLAWPMWPNSVISSVVRLMEHICQITKHVPWQIYKVKTSKLIVKLINRLYQMGCSPQQPSLTQMRAPPRISVLGESGDPCIVGN